MKKAAAIEAGFNSITKELPGDVAQEALLNVVQQLNDDPMLDGILVQLPLPDHIEQSVILKAIDFEKDVDIRLIEAEGGSGRRGTVQARNANGSYTIARVKADVRPLEEVGRREAGFPDGLLHLLDGRRLSRCGGRGGRRRSGSRGRCSRLEEA